MLEDWVPDADTPSTTGYLARVAAFQRHNATSAYLAAGGIERNLASTRKPVRRAPLSSLSVAVFLALTGVALSHSRICHPSL